MNDGLFIPNLLDVIAISYWKEFYPKEQFIKPKQVLFWKNISVFSSNLNEKRE